MRDHPIATVLILWAVFIVIVIGLLLRRAWLRRNEGFTDTLPDRDAPPVLELRVEDRVTPELERLQRRFHSGGIIKPSSTGDIPLILPRGEHRLPMRNRFLAPAEGGEEIVSQILADQAEAHEEPGEEVTDPDVEPDAAGQFYHLRESIGQFTYILGKDGYLGISEAMRDGSETEVYAVPEEWREPITVAVFEVARLRHGQ